MSWRLRWFIVAPVVLFVLSTVLMSSCGGGSRGCNGSFDAFGNFLPGVCPSPGPGLGFNLESIAIIAGPTTPATPTVAATKGQTPTPRATIVPSIGPTAGPTAGIVGGQVDFHARGVFMKGQRTTVTDLTGLDTLWTSDNQSVLAPPPQGPNGAYHALSVGCACAGVSAAGVTAPAVKVAVVASSNQPTPACPVCPTPAPSATSTPKPHRAAYDENVVASAQSSNTRINGVLQWMFDGASPIASQLVASAEGNLYFLTRDGFLHALDATGRERWARRCAGSSIALAPDGTVYALAPGGSLEALSSRGKPLWSMNVASTIGPVAASSSAVYIQEDKQLVALASPGVVQWRAAAADEITSAAVAAGGTIVAASKGASVIAITSDGSRRWSFAPQGGFAGEIAIRQNAIYLGSSSGRLYALSTSNGGEQWHYDTSAAVGGGPVLNAAGPIFFSSDAVYALTADGQLAWSKTIIKGSLSPLASDGEGGLFAPANDDITTMLNSDGSQRWATRSFGVVDRAFISGSGVLYVAAQGRVYAVQ